MTRFHTFTDGSCLYNGKPNAIAGFGVVIFEESDDFYCEIFSQSERVDPKLIQTNNTGELSAILNAMQYFIRNNLQSEEIILYTDSMYCINSVSNEGDCWYIGWIQNGWVNTSKKPVMNKEIIQKILQYKKLFCNFRFQHVKAHQKKPKAFENDLEELKWNGNDIVDELAKKAIGLI